MPSLMTAGVAPPLTAQRESRPTSRKLSIDPNLDLAGGDENATASSSNISDDRKGNSDDADDESSGKDPSIVAVLVEELWDVDFCERYHYLEDVNCR